ncbi:plant cysteine oxidase 2-like [Malania oleifera]|uniref:plant cysteine oxidase 2-like n=1 Tax=Malania oleifera TaxID=397392 RepID=UPI0025AE56BE|nr:plant cysteine oxidase 2-like [Malania oleifera]
MRVEAREGDEEVQNGSELTSEKKQNKKSKKKKKNNGGSDEREKKKSKNRKSMPNVVQELFETCRQVFRTGRADYIPPPEDIQRIRHVLDCMSPQDVGLRPDMPYFTENDPTEGAPPVTYIHVYECEKFSMGIFCLPPSGVIPLHNHPGMTVFGKLLFGSMHVKSYDWVHANISSSTYSRQPGLRLAKVQVDSQFTAPCSPSILYPAEGGNMHCFTALTSCAILDVLGPPYSDSQGRPCTYYQECPLASFPAGETGLLPDEEEGHAWLEEWEKPESFVVVGDDYRGLEIVEN